MSKQISREYIERIGKKNGRYNARTSTGGSGGQGEGVSSLAQLRDVTIENEADGNVLVYNETDEKWKNQEKAPKAVQADKVGTSSVGAIYMPIYLYNGVPTVCGSETTAQETPSTTFYVNITGTAAKVPWTGVQNVIQGGNEFNFCDSTPSGNQVYINYRGRQGLALSTRITEYHFGNGSGSTSTVRDGVTVRAENFLADGYVTALSDEREKDIAGDIELDLDEIADAPAIKFIWKNRDDNHVNVGSIAQYWQDVLPEVVRKQSEGLLTMDYAVAALISAIKLAREVRSLKEKLAEQGIKV